MERGSKVKAERINWRMIVYLLFFAVMFYIAWQVPYCHDEWQWGLEDRVELMKRGFENYNGRYLGNILALIITRSVPAKALILSGGLLWLLMVLNSQKAEKNVFFMLVSIILLLAVPRTLFAQSYGWPAAFVNFVPPVILFLIYYNWTEAIYKMPDVKYARIQVLLAVPLGIATQLFSEHITVFVLLYAAWVIIFAWIRNRKVYPLHLSYFISAALGAVIMFSNGAYRNAAVNEKAYKHISFGIGAMAEQFLDGILDPLFYDNWLLNVLFAVVLILFVIKSRKKNWLAAEMVLVFNGYAVYSIWNRVYPDWMFVGNPTANGMIRTALAALFFLNVLLCVWFYTASEEKYGICILYISAACVAVPLLAANPIGSRCFLYLIF